jgi:hypothetical protein
MVWLSTVSICLGELGLRIMRGRNGQTVFPHGGLTKGNRQVAFTLTEVSGSPKSVDANVNARLFVLSSSHCGTALTARL